jgi:riboflavin kinase/FMN adenylyltransferase
LSQAQGKPSLAIVFEPHPREFFCKEAPGGRLSLLTDKTRLLRQYGMDVLVPLHFTKRFSEMTAMEFVNKILIKQFHVTTLVVGEDFRFGYRRSGSIEDLRAAGIAVEIVPAVTILGERVSSTRARQALIEADFSTLQSLLGHAYTVTGKVIHGAKQGRLLGFPTLNIALPRKMVVHGVYVVKIHGLSVSPYYGVANVGRRPTLNPLMHPLLEVYVFDYDGDAYQRRLSIEFLHKLRDEAKFESLGDLKHKIMEDVNRGKNYARHH